MANRIDTKSKPEQKMACGTQKLPEQAHNCLELVQAPEQALALEELDNIHMDHMEELEPYTYSR